MVKKLGYCLTKDLGSKKPEFLFLYLYRKAKRFKDKQKTPKAL